MRKSWLARGLFALVCLAAAAAGHLIVVRLDGLELPAIWPLSGVLVALLIVEPRRPLPGVIIATAATFLVDVAAGQRTTIAAPLALVFAVQSLLAARVIRHLCGHPSPTRLTHVWAIAAVGVLAPMAGGVLASAVFAIAGVDPALAWWSWWLMHALAIVLIAPLGMAAAAARVATVRIPRAFELALVLVSGTAVSVIVFSGSLGPFVRVPAYLLPFFLWSVFRFGVGGTAATVLVLSLAGLWYAAQGRGPFALPGASPQDWVLRAQGTMLVAAASLLLLAGAVAERRRVARENEMLVADLQRALAEIKTLRGFIPICAWCHKVRDDAGFWQGIETYLDERTDATFSHSICPACADRAQAEIAEHATGDKPDGGSAFL